MAIFDDLMTANVVLGRPGLAGTGITAAEKTTIDTRLGALEAGHPLGDHTNIDETGAADGMAILRSGTGYVLGDPSGAISQVRDATKTVTDVTDLVAHHGLQLDPAGGATGTAFFQPVWGGTGTAETVSRSNHTHTTPTFFRAETAASGNLSSGSRAAGSLNVTLSTGVTYLVKATLKQTVRGSGGSSFYTLTLNIGSDIRTSIVKQTVGGVPSDPEFVHTRTMTGFGTGITVIGTITYNSGDPVDVRAAELEVELHANR